MLEGAFFQKVDLVGLDGDLEDRVSGHVLMMVDKEAPLDNPTDLSEGVEERSAEELTPDPFWHILQEGKRSNNHNWHFHFVV